MKIKPVYYCILCLILLGMMMPLLGRSQNVNSPYSVYGIGDFDHKVYDRTVGMGGTGLAIPSGAFLINNNPAGISGLQRSFYIMNVAGTGKFMHYTGDATNADNSSNKDFWVKGISLAAKINGFWASGIGFNQLTNVNYVFNGFKQIEGTTQQYLVNFQGDGGLNEFYWNNAFNLGNHFAVGVKASYIAGSINQTENVTDASLTDNVVSKQQDYYRHIRLEFGGMYFAKLSKQWDLNLGGKWINKTKLTYDRDLTVTENNTSIVNDQFVNRNDFFLPMTFGGGIALIHNRKTTYAADYTYENWANINTKGTGWQMVNSSRISGGVEFSNQVKKWNQTFEKRFFQVGAYVDQSYLQVRDHNINSFGLSVGTGGSFSGLLYNVALEGGQRGTTQASLIRESYVQLTICLSYRDFLFSKGRKYN